MRSINRGVIIIFIITSSICSTLGHGDHGHSHGGDEDSHEEHDHSDFSVEDEFGDDMHTSSDAHVDDAGNEDTDTPAEPQPPAKPRERVTCSHCSNILILFYCFRN